jgi:hypothetical protein
MTIGFSRTEWESLERLRAAINGALDRKTSLSEALNIAGELIFMHDLSVSEAASNIAARYREGKPQGVVEHAEALPLEMKKLGPGRYLIEGWHVDHAEVASHETGWRAVFAGHEPLFAPTLRELKEKIQETLR